MTIEILCLFRNLLKKSKNFKKFSLFVIKDDKKSEISCNFVRLKSCNQIIQNPMKRVVCFLGMALCGVILLGGLQSCDKVENLAKFDVKMDLPSLNFNLVASAKNSSTQEYYKDFNVYLNLDSIQEAHSLNSFSIENGKLTKATLRIIYPAGANFQFLINSRLVLFNSSNQEMQVAHTGNINANATEIELILDTADLTSLFKMKHYTGRIYYTIAVSYTHLTLPTIYSV